MSDAKFPFSCCLSMLLLEMVVVVLLSYSCSSEIVHRKMVTVRMYTGNRECKWMYLGEWIPEVYQNS